MKTVTIEWRHLDLDKGTCLRCSKTGRTLYEVISELKDELEPKGITILFNETKVSVQDIQQSNMILINGQPIEHILSGAQASENYCSSCSCLTRNEIRCRTIKYNGKTYEEIPEELIRMAVFTTINTDKKGDGS